MIDISADKLVPIAKAAKLFATPDNPKGPHVASLYRWIDGKLVRPRKGGEPVLIKLETILVAGDRFTTAACVQAFCEAETAARDGIESSIATRGTRQKQRDVSRAKEIMAKGAA